MRALIDGDILPYEFGGLTKKAPEEGQDDLFPDIEEGDTLPFEVCWGALCKKIEHIKEATNAEEITIFLSSQEIPTWRYEAATILPYKEHRVNQEKPRYWELIRTNLKLHYPCEVVEFIEADDAMSIEQYKNYNHICENIPDISSWGASKHSKTVICSRDKDLNMVPGWHYSWGTSRSPEKPMWFQTKTGGLRCFYKQLLTGDHVDNILGLYGVGEKSALVKKLDELGTEQEMFAHVYEKYQDRFGSYAQQFLYENGLLLKMQETREERWDVFDKLVLDYEQEIRSKGFYLEAGHE